ncbi:hypothetical protein SAMN04488109_4947 [Chryseolinea serpens]|uniref:Uncharacterized protein n=1 Tax=Chryseolinea serpens TaxID=947013 RepID=A0A1M5V9T7_9BACT|nr:hypothetical protein [Chryseolinea serpens]SHH71990.1 hypothetical protein SAMN04488109_4947 [Chryseolinea serpens]
MEIGNVSEINEVKAALAALQQRGLVLEWSLPYENLLTRLTAAIFYVSLDEEGPEEVWKTLQQFPRFACLQNETRQLSALPWRVEFNTGFSL